MTLEELELNDLIQVNSWKTINEDEDLEPFLEPATKNINGRLIEGNGSCWCLSNVLFSNGTKFYAISRCRADDSEIPLNWSVWNGKEFIPLLVPPVPQFVLDIDGPNYFCEKFDLNLEEVFPMVLIVKDEFDLEPHKRTVTIDTVGVVDNG